MIKFPQNIIIKRFLSLAVGSVAGQAMMFIALPIATQIYSPADFGVLAAFSSLVLLVLPAACLRLDLAIPISKDEQEVLGIVLLSFMSATLIAAVYGVVLSKTSELWGHNNQEVIDSYVWLIVLALWAAAVFSLIQYWAIRLKKFKELAISHALRGMTGAAVQIGLGIMGFGVLGLIFGQTIYMGLGALALTFSVLATKIGTFKSLTLNRLGSVLKKNWRFPIFSTPEALVNSANTNLPMLLIIALVGIDAGGVLYIAQRLTSIPVGLISGNLSRVYIGEAPERDLDKKLFSFTSKLFFSLFCSALPVAIIIFLFARPIATSVFGPAWDSTAQYLIWLVPAALLQLSVVPVATVLHIRSRQAIAFLLQVSGFILQIGVIWFCATSGAADPVLGFAVGSALHYAIYSIVVLLVARD
ncbi:oligosaccharide flippase family protein [Rhodobacteraceae bacterium]|nr:oligosaccharide flippase family protein [Paracoccaceae bacterium]